MSAFTRIPAVRGDHRERRFIANFSRSHNYPKACTSLADKIVGADRVAEVGPTAGAPVVDEANVAHQRFEPLGFAFRFRWWAISALRRQ